MKNETSFTVEETPLQSHRLNNLTANKLYIVYVTAVNDNGESRPSETLMAWTDPAFPPIVEVPTVHPNSIIMEGSSMTVLCVAMGTPMPVVSLYVAGALARQERTRHLVHVLPRVNRTMNVVSCYAENGYGQPAESSKRVVIGRSPNVTGTVINMANLGDDVVLRCQVDAHPTPQVFFSRDADGLDAIANSTKYETRLVKQDQVSCAPSLSPSCRHHSDTDDSMMIQ